MKRFIFALIGLLLCAAPALAAQVPIQLSSDRLVQSDRGEISQKQLLAQMNLLTGAGGKFRASATPSFSLSFTDHQEEASGGTTITYTACAIGAANSNRIVVVAIGARMTTVNTISSVTIGGVAATLVPGSVAQFGGANGSNSAIYQAAVPTGTTANVVVTYGAAAARTGIAVYRIVTGTPTANSSDAKSNNGSISNGSLTISPGGAGLAFAFNQSNPTTVSWSNATQDYSAVSGTTSQVTSATVSATSTAIGSGMAVGAQIFSAAAWGP